MLWLMTWLGFSPADLNLLTFSFSRSVSVVRMAIWLNLPEAETESDKWRRKMNVMV